MNLNESYIRSQENDTATLCSKLNSISNYVSPAALWNRPDLLESMIESKDVPDIGFVARNANGSVAVHVGSDHIISVDEIRRPVLEVGVQAVGRISPLKTVQHVQKQVEHALGGPKAVQVMQSWIQPAIERPSSVTSVAYVSPSIYQIWAVPNQFDNTEGTHDSAKGNSQHGHYHKHHRCHHCHRHHHHDCHHHDCHHHHHHHRHHRCKAKYPDDYREYVNDA